MESGTVISSGRIGEATVELIAITPDAEKVLESAGRTCYLSFDKATDESAGKFVKMISNTGHTSVLEHASATFRIKGGSRAFTHQLVRHRLGSFSQQSQRYVNEKKFEFVTPPAIADNREAKEVYDKLMADTQEAYLKLKSMKIRKEDARYVLPNAAVSEIVMSGNFRTWRHLISLRTEKHAQWEIRAISAEILKQLHAQAPSVFEDLLE